MMKQTKEKKEKESFMNAMIVYGFIAIALIGFLGYTAGSIAIGSTFILGPMLFKGAGTGKDGMFSNSPTKKIKDVWRGADKKKKAGIVVSIMVLLPFFILGALWLAMIGAMFLVDLLFILPIVMIILWFWFRNPKHQTFNGSASLGHPAVLGVAVVMILVIAIVAGMNYMDIHKYDGLEAKDVVKSYTSPSEAYHTDTDGDGTIDVNDTDIDGDNITNELDIDQNGDGIVDNWYPINNLKNFNESTQLMINAQWDSIPDENKAYIDPTPAYREEDFIVDNGTVKAKNFTVVVHVYDPFADEVFPLQRTVNYVNMRSIFGLPQDLEIPHATLTKRTIVNISVNNTNINETLNASAAGTDFVTFNQMSLPLATTEKGTPIEYMNVELIAKPKSAKFKNPNSGTATWRAITDATGTAILEIPTGDYTLRVEGAGYLPYQSDFRVTNRTKDVTAFLTPSYMKVDVYFQARNYGDTSLQYFGEANVNFNIGDGPDSITLYTIGSTVEGFTKEDYNNTLRQNSMYGWSGIPNLVVNPSVKTNKMFQSMFNSMAQGLNGIWWGQRKELYATYQNANFHLSATFEQGDVSGTRPVYVETMLTQGSEYSTNTYIHNQYVVWPKGMIGAQNGVVVNFNVEGNANYKVDEYEKHVDYYVLIAFPDTSESHDIKSIPIDYSFNYTLTGTSYQLFYQA